MLDFLQKQKTETESFWAVLIEEQWITSSVWQIIDGKVNIVSTSIPTRWEEDILTAIDTSLSSCMQNLPEDFKDPEKTVFGLPSSWIEGGSIKDEHLNTLKKVCDELSLIPTGFVVLSEAIANYYKNEEGSGITSVIVGVSDQNLEVSVFNLGNLVGVTNVARSVSIEDDFTEGLTRLSGSSETLPSRVILFNQKESELEDIKEELNGSDWAKIGAGKFIHTPRVEIFNPLNKVIAVTLAGGLELGATNGLSSIESSEKNINNTETEVKNEDVQVLNEENYDESLINEEVINVKEAEDLNPSDFGFEVEPIDQPKNNNPELTTQKSFHLPQMPKINNFKLTAPKINLPKLSLFKGGKFLTISMVAVISFFVFFIFIWWFYPSANITIYVSPKVLEENISVDLNSDLESQEVSVEVQKEKTKATTGTKTVGDKAKGQVKIQNGTAFPINLASGSVLTSGGDLKFVTLSSASISGALSPSNPGTATIDVEASSIGSEFNLSKDEVFKVSNYPKAEVDATSVNGFTGGSSRQISAVSEDDRKSLLKDLENELLEEAKEKLQQQTSTDQFLIEETISLEKIEEDFSNKVGDESNNLSLNLQLKVSAKLVSKTSLAKISRDTLQNKIPEGFTLRDDQLSYEFTTEDENINTRVKANLLPSLDSTEIAKKISGKYPNIAEEYLKSVPGFVRAEFRVKPLFPGKLGTLPHVVKRIDIEFSADN